MRADGKRLRNLDPYFEIIPYIMDKRIDAMNMVHCDIPLEPIEAYMRAKREEGKRVSHLGLFLAAYIRVAAEMPMLNRFVVNKRIFARNHFCISFVVLKQNPKTGESMDTAVKIPFQLDETVFEVCEKIEKTVQENRTADFENPMDKLLKKLFYLPSLVSFVVWCYKLMDKVGLLPKSILLGSPFHTSLFLTNMASLRNNYIYHHIYEFGTTSIFIALGKFISKTEMKDGVPQEVRYMPVGTVMDERIADGFYFSKAWQKMEYYLKHPELLEERPAEVKKEMPW